VDLHEIAEIVAGEHGRLRLRQGTVTAIAADGSLTVTIAGSDAAVSGVHSFASVCPIIGSAVWLVTDGLDLIAVGTVTPTGPAYCSLTRTNAGTLETGTWYDLSFAENVRTDPYGMWSADLPNLITIATPGVYSLFGTVTFNTNATGRRDVRIRVNAATVATHNQLAVTGTVTSICVSTLHELFAGDYIQLGARQSSGANLDIVAGGPEDTRLTVAWLRPVT